MPVFSVGPAPVKSKWYAERHAVGKLKEVLGSVSIFHWHCGRPMRGVVTYQRTPRVKTVPEEIRRCGVNSWICRVCGIREYYDDPMC